MKRYCVICVAAFAGLLHGQARASDATPNALPAAATLALNALVFGPATVSPVVQFVRAEDRRKDAAASDTASVGLAQSPAADAAVPSIAQRLQELVTGKLQTHFPREQDRNAVASFYTARNFAPIWVTDNGPNERATAAIGFLKNLGAEGLDPADYPVPKFAGDLNELAEAELALSASVLRFVRHASIGRIAFSRVSGSIYFEQRAPDVADVLNKIAEAGDVAATLDSFNPQAPQYKALKAQLAALRTGNKAEMKATAEAPKPAGKKSKQSKAEAKPATASIDTVIANMERWRWNPHDLGAAYVMVNIPDYTLKVVQDNKPLWTTKIVAGKPGEQATPLLTETMKFITVNPTWNVPPSIIRNEYLPALARDPDALSRVGLKVGRNKDGSIRIFQPPGEKNALGRIRFNFPNRFLVYQHDTPNKDLFAKSERAFSHGCMRVQYPDQYAETLLRVSQPEDNYTAARVHSMYGSSERTITLKRPIPVYLTYQTAFVDDAGKLQTRRDVYGLDAQITRILRTERAQADVPVARNYNSSSKPVMARDTRKRRNEESTELWSGPDRRSYGRSGPWFGNNNIW